MANNQEMIKTDLHILMLEDDTLDVELNIQQLNLLEEYNCIVNIAVDENSFINSLENWAPDVILSDYNLPQYNGLLALNEIKKRNISIPFIFVTGAMNEETAADTIKAGAWDYVVKDRLFRLPLAVRGALKLKEEKKIAVEAEEKIRRLLTAIEQTSAQIIVLTDTGLIEYVNNKFTEITGFTFHDVIGKSASILIPEDDNKLNIEEISEKLKKGEVFRQDILSRKKDGSSIWELVSITPIKSHDNRISSYVIVKEDITQQKNLENELIKAVKKAEQSDSLKDVFLQNLSHEIRTPLNAIVGFSYLICNDVKCNASEKSKEFATIIQKSSNQLLSIVNDVLTVASIETGQEKISFNPVNINSVIDHLVDIFTPVADQKKLDFIISKYNDDGIVTLTDETKLTQILTNLLNNAFKFTEKGYVELKYYVSGKSLEFLVKDTGIGISKESQKIIFERFRQASESVQTNYGGTGLGLSISKAFSQMIDGNIRVESNLGKGSEFYLTIPLESDEKELYAEKNSSNANIKKKVFTILIAEDEADNFELIKAFLDHENINLLHAINGYEALKMCKENPRIDMVLMDIKMPVMNGIASFNEIKKIRKNIKIVAQTAYALEMEKKEILETGFDNYISKPIKKAELIKIIEQCRSSINSK